MTTLKEVGNSFKHFCNSYTLKDEYYHCLTSNATKLVSHKLCSIIGKQVSVNFLYLSNRLPYQQYGLLKISYILMLRACSLKTYSLIPTY